MNSRRLPRAMALLLLVASSLPGTAAQQQWESHAYKGQPQLRVLAVPLLPTSPTMDMMAVAAELEARGHQVLVVAADAHLQFFKDAAARHSSNTTAEALEYLAVNLTALAEQGTSPQHKHVKPGQVTQARFAVPHFPRTLTAGLELELVIQDVVAEPCATLLQDSRVFKAMQDFQPDAVMAIGMPVPDTATDSCGCLLSHALKVPMIDIDCGMTFWSGPPSAPQFGSGLTPSQLSTISGSIQNFVTWLIKQAAMPVLTGLRATPWSAARDRLGLPRASSTCPVVDGVLRLMGHSVWKCDVTLNAILGSWLIEYPRPLAPHQVLLGPGTPRSARAIQQAEVATFVAGASNGLILVAFGTSFQFNKWLTLVDYQELAGAFASLSPLRVLWHINTKVLPAEVVVEDLDLGGNTLMVPVVDYNDVLGHPNCRAFVSHCGLHSVYEAAYHGVPVVGVPFMFEQAESCTKLASRGAAVMCHQAPAFRSGAAAHAHHTREHLTALISQVLDNSSYRTAAARLSVVLRTQLKRHHPYAAAADEVELAINTRLASSQRQHRQGLPAVASAGAADDSRMSAAEGSAGQTGLTRTEL